MHAKNSEEMNSIVLYMLSLNKIAIKILFHCLFDNIQNAEVIGEGI